MLSENTVTLSMGEPITAPVLVPVLHSSTPTCINNPFMVNGKCYRVTAMSFGNPHGAVFVDDVDKVDLQTLGSALGNHVLFPKGANIVFIQPVDRENIKARLWQRGDSKVTFTPEAACVAGTAAMMCQKVLYDGANVSLGGNVFRMKWNRGSGEVTLTGPEALLKAKKAKESDAIEINTELISYLEDLSCLSLADDEKQRLTVELEDILGYMARLGELDTESIPERSHPISHVNAFRDDVVHVSFDRAFILKNALLKNEEAFIAPTTVM